MKYFIQVSTRALPGREAEYERWYEEIHIAEVLAVPGFLACERYERSILGAEQSEYLAAYEVETDDPTALLQSLFAMAPTMQKTDSMDPKGTRFEILRPIGGRVSADGLGGSPRIG